MSDDERLDPPLPGEILQVFASYFGGCMKATKFGKLLPAQKNECYDAILQVTNCFAGLPHASGQ